MRRIEVQAPQGAGREVLRLAGEHEAEALTMVAGQRDGAALDVVYVHLPNAEVGEFLEALESVEGARSILAPQSVLPSNGPAPRWPSTSRTSSYSAHSRCG